MLFGAISILKDHRWNDDSSDLQAETTSALASVEGQKIEEDDLESGVSTSHITLQVGLRKYRDAMTALEAQEEVRSLRDAGLEYSANWAELELARICDNEPIPEFEIPNQPRNSWAIEGLTAYCANWDPSMLSTSVSELRKLTSNEVYDRHQLKKSLGNADPELRLAIIQELLDSARTPEELTVVAAGLVKLIEANDPTQFPNLGQAPGTNKQDLIAGIASANLMYECSRFGGCAANQPKILQMCAHSPSCEPGWGIEDFLINNLSAFQMEQAIEILNHLYPAPVGG